MILKEVIKQEGNEKEFSYRGYDCQILRVMPEHLGHLCGYLRIPKESELYGLDYDQIEQTYNFEIPSHGGITYASYRNNEKEYWVGFDCAHSRDLLPVAEERYRGQGFGFAVMGDATYRDMDYVEKVLKEMIDFIIKQEENK